MKASPDIVMFMNLIDNPIKMKPTTIIFTAFTRFKKQLFLNYSYANISHLSMYYQIHCTLNSRKVSEIITYIVSTNKQTIKFWLSSPAIVYLYDWMLAKKIPYRHMGGNKSFNDDDKLINWTDCVRIITSKCASVVAFIDVCRVTHPECNLS